VAGPCTSHVDAASTGARGLPWGVEPLDAVGGGRIRSALQVVAEDRMVPLDLHPSGRFARGHRAPVPDSVVVRLVEPAAGASRRVVPRRLTLDLTQRRTFAAHLFPGAGASLPTGATVVRGRVSRRDPATGGAVPVRWTRVRATCPVAPGAGADLGWAHGDDRGEFVLVLDAAARALQLTVGAATGAPPSPAAALADPLVDLPPEPTAAHDGRAFLIGQTPFGPFAVTVPPGRESSIEIVVP
jgi:hypothetical protein